ncbi:MAG TPA: GIY-YIG nuclease family protein [Sphingomicrobium sp.]|nr:GIY-YIG nuclease family protein [Sphingomicrobium sp.]
MSSKAPTGWVYYIGAIEAETPRIKIGFTKASPHVRMKALQTGSPCPLALLAVQRGSVSDEQRLHDQFADTHLHGEWFELSEALYQHICTIVWLQANQSMILGEPIERWVRVGLQSMHESHPLPEELAALL